MEYFWDRRYLETRIDFENTWMKKDKTLEDGAFLAKNASKSTGGDFWKFLNEIFSMIKDKTFKSRVEKAPKNSGWYF